MAKGKYQEWLTEDGLTLLRAWARDGLSDEQLAKNMDIVPSTLYEWKNKHKEIAEALKRGKAVVDVEVENALHRRAMGYTVEIKKTFKIRSVDYNPDTGKRIREREELVTGIDEVHVPADTTAQIFWLKNRKPQEWRNNPDSADSDAGQMGKLIEGLRDG